MGTGTEKSSVQQAEAQPLASWASVFLDYFDLKARPVSRKPVISDHLKRSPKG